MRGPNDGIATWISVQGWRQDLSLAARSLKRSPGFSFVVVVSLAVCFGPNTAILAALHALILKPLPFADAGQLVRVVNVAEKAAGQVLESSMSQYADFRDQADRFAGFAVVRSGSGWLEEGDAPERVAMDAVTTDYFALLKVAPVRGRFFLAKEGASGGPPVLVIGEAYWESHYGADPGVIGREVRWDGQRATIIGVAPRSLEALRRQTAIFQPYAPGASRFDPQLRYRGDVTVYGRLRSGISTADGVAQLRGLEANFQRDEAPVAIRTYAEQAGFRVALEPLRSGGGRGDTARMLWLLQASGVLVLVIGSVNTLNLVLARWSAKESELAVRVALGAGRAVLWRQGLAESGWLVGGAMFLGGGATLAALRVFNGYLPVLMPAASPVTLSPAVIGMTLAGAAGEALVLGILPVWAQRRGSVELAGGRSVTRMRSGRGWRGGLVSAQVALAVVLLVGANLLVRSFRNVMAIEPGFAADRVVVGRITLPRSYLPTAPLKERYADGKAAANVGLQQRIVEAMGQIPGVERVSQSLEPIINPLARPVPFVVRDGEMEASADPRLVHIVAVAPDFFATLGMEVREGRDFAAGERFAEGPVAIVDEFFAQRYFSGRSVEGHSLGLSKGLPLADEAWVRVVGVVSRAQFAGLDSADNLPIVFVPMAGFPVKSFDVMVRSNRTDTAMMAEMRAQLRETDPELVMSKVALLQSDMDALLAGRRGVTLLLGAFSVVAVGLAAIGLYGMLAYDVTRRTREIGIRSAIGATRWQILRLVLGHGAGQIARGTVIGTIVAGWLSRGLDRLLFGLGSGDLASYGGAVAMIAGVGLAACWLPAWKAAKIDPLVALRAE